MKTKFIITFLFIFAFLSLYFCIGGFPVVINSEKEILNFNTSDNQHFNPLENADFSFGKNKVVLLFDFDDIAEQCLQKKGFSLFRQQNFATDEKQFYF